MQGMSAAEIRASVNAGISGTAITRNGEPAIPIAPDLTTTDSLLDSIIGAAKKVIPKAVSTAQAAMAQLSYSGSTGNFTSAEETITLVGRFLPLVDQYPEKIGSPLNKAVMLNTLSGFAVCKDAVFSAVTATTTEETAVEQFLNSGFFFE